MKIYTKICASTLFVVFFAYTIATAPAFAITTSSNGGTSAPATESNGSTSSTPAPAPATESNGSTSSTPAPAPVTASNGGTSAPATQNNGSTSDKPAPATVSNGSTSGSPVTPPTPPVTNPGNSGTPSGGGNVSSGSGFVSNGSGSTASVINISGTPSCSYLNSYLTMGGQNNSAEVTKLQTFLKNTEKLDVEINGNFDQKTFDAVKAFQAKYVNETMAPWGVTTPTGRVFYTTKKKINEIVCKSTFALTANEISTINAYKNSVVSDVESITTSDVVGSTSSTTNSQVASPANTSVASKIWGFVKWLFGY